MKKIFSSLFPRGIFTVRNETGKINLFMIAFPMLLENILSNVIGFIGSAVLSGYSDNAVAATGSANTVIGLISIIIGVVSTGAGVIVCFHLGADDLPNARKASFVALTVSALVGTVLSAGCFFCSVPLMRFMNLTGEVLDFAILYFRIRMGFLLFSSFSTAFSTFLRCYGYARLTVISGLITIGLNLLLNVFVIRFPEYSPVTGVAGIAVGNVVSQGVGMTLNLLFVKIKKIGFSLPVGKAEWKTHTGKMVAIGVPSGVSSCSYALSQVLSASFVALIGMSAVTAKVYYGNILGYTYLVSFSFGSAGALLIGRLVGAGDFEHAEKFNRALTVITCSFNLLLSLVAICFRYPLLSVFTRDEAILSAALSVFLLDAVAEEARGISHVYEYALRGAGDVNFMMAVTIASCWLFAVGLAYLLAVPLGMGLLGCWIGVAVDEWTRAIASLLRWRTGKWKTKLKKSPEKVKEEHV